jgi:hypothetical protein
MWSIPSAGAWKETYTHDTRYGTRETITGSEVKVILNRKITAGKDLGNKGCDVKREEQKFALLLREASPFFKCRIQPLQREKKKTKHFKLHIFWCRERQSSWPVIDVIQMSYMPEAGGHSPRSHVFNYTPVYVLLLTYTIEHSPSWQANWFAASQEIPRIL